MPSGFQQDTNQLQPNFYRVSIDTSGYPTADGNDNGGITPNSSDSFGTLPTTLIKGKQRSRGNLRFQNIVNRLTTLADCQILDISITEANADAQATAIAFTVKFDRDTFISGTKADTIKAAVAQGIIDETTANVRVYNGDDDTDNQLLISVTKPVTDPDGDDHLGEAIEDVTVTLNSETTLINA
jgi:hypothetical protein